MLSAHSTPLFVRLGIFFSVEILRNESQYPERAVVADALKGLSGEVSSMCMPRERRSVHCSS